MDGSITVARVWQIEKWTSTECINPLCSLAVGLCSSDRLKKWVKTLDAGDEDIKTYFYRSFFIHLPLEICQSLGLVDAQWPKGANEL